MTDMPKAKPQSCGTCLHAVFERSVRGTVLNKAGRCDYPLNFPHVLPSCIPIISVNRLAIWPGDGNTCPTFKPKFPGRPKETK